MICIPVVAASNEEAKKQMEKSVSLADIIELRIDFIRSANLKHLLASPGRQVLVTNRRKDEGGHFIGDERDRISLLCDAVTLGAHLVDIELRSGETHIQQLKKRIAQHDTQTTLIISHHNATDTPQYGDLVHLFEKCTRQGADIVKIITFAQSIEDNLEILKLVSYARKANQEIIAFCMGARGKISRVMAPLFGSFCTFASIEKGAESAPGQLTALEMKKILRMLDHER